MSWRRGRKPKKRSVSFNPNRKYINSAVDEYLKKGGTIKKIEVDDEAAYQAFIKMRDAAADDFLNDTKI